MIGTTMALEWAGRVFILFLSCLVIAKIMRRAPAVSRRLLYSGAFVTALALTASPLAPAGLQLSIAAPPSAVSAPTATRGASGLGEMPAPPDVASASTSSALATAEVAPTTRASVSPVDVMFALWLMVALFLFARLSGGHLRAHRLRRRATAVEPARLPASFVHAAAGSGASVCLSREVRVPMTVGLFRAVVLLPDDAIDAWSEARLERVLLHELAHIKSGDVFIQLVAELVCVLHWFNPLVYSARAGLYHERELAADDTVLARGVQPSAYARDLLELAEPGDKELLAGVSISRGSGLTRRITAVLAATQPRSLPRRRALAITLVPLVLGTAAACLTTEPTKGPTSPASPATVSVAEPVSTELPARARVESRVAPFLPARGAVVVGLLDGTSVRVDSLGSTPADGDTVFGLGSISELVTGLAFADMLVDEDVAGDDEVAALLPDAAIDRDMTLMQLATHRAGLPALPSNFVEHPPGQPGRSYTLPMLYDELSAEREGSANVAEFSYSYFGVGLLGHALGEREGKSFRDVVASRVFDELALTSTDFLSESARLETRFAVGHDGSGQVLSPRFDDPVLGACCGARSSANDLVRLVRLFLDPDSHALGPAAHEMMTPRAETGRVTGEQIGIGWHFSLGGLLFKRGGGRGFSSAIVLDRTRARAVIVLAGAENVPVDQLSLELLREMELSSARGPDTPYVDTPDIDQRVNAELGDRIRYLGWSTESDTAAPGQTVSITFYFEALRPLTRDWQVFVHGDSANGARIHGDHYPAGGSTTRWAPGRIVQDQFEITIPTDYAEPSFTIWTGLYGGGGRLEVSNDAATDGHGKIEGPTIAVEAR